MPPRVGESIRCQAMNGDIAMLRAKKPEAVTKRLKLFMFGPAGVGKTTAAIQFPKSYIIDCEKGAENYDKLITASGTCMGSIET